MPQANVLDYQQLHVDWEIAEVLMLHVVVPLCLLQHLVRVLLSSGRPASCSTPACTALMLPGWPAGATQVSGCGLQKEEGCYGEDIVSSVWQTIVSAVAAGIPASPVAKCSSACAPHIVAVSR